MTKKLLLVLPLLGAALLVSLFPPTFAQSNEKKVPEEKAFKEARDTKDPRKKLEALETFLKDYPYGMRADSVRELILDTVIKNWPAQKDQIKAAAENMIDTAPFWNKTSVYDDVANKLIAARVMPEFAEELAAKGLAAEEKELEETARKTRASYLGTLGRALLNNGKAAEAEKTLKEAYSLDPSSPAVDHGLAEIAEKRGDLQQALSYEMAAFLTSQSSEEARPRTKIEELYRKLHGSLDGLDAALDARYEKESPNPLAVERYHSGRSRTNRVVLAELFTGAGCAPCAAADLAFDGLAERYSHNDLAVLIYHLHIPRPDPMTNPSAQTRHDFYTPPGTPTYVIDGDAVPGGGGRDYANTLFNRIVSAIDPELEKPPEASIVLTARLEANHVVVNANLDRITSTSKDLRLQIALVEDKLRYSGENGIRFHNMVVRSLAGDKEGGFVVAAGQPASIKQDFDIGAISNELKKSLDDYEVAGHRGEPFTFTEKKYQIDPAMLSVVAFVQDNTTKNVLQAVYTRVSPAGGPEGK